MKEPTKRKRPSTGNPVGRPRTSEFKGESFYLHKNIRDYIAKYCGETNQTKSQLASKVFTDYFGL